MKNQSTAETIVKEEISQLICEQNTNDLAQKFSEEEIDETIDWMLDKAIIDHQSRVKRILNLILTPKHKLPE